MAKPKTPARAPAAAAVVTAIDTVILPEGLVDLMVAAAEAAKTLIRSSAESVAKPDDADLQAAATGAGDVLTKALAAIETWFQEYLSTRLAAADSEAERQLEEKRAILKTLLEELDTKVQALTARRAQVDADLEAFTNALTPEDTVPAVPVAIDVPAGMELITVIGPAAGLRRAGHLFNAVPNAILVTAEQKALIEADPALSLVDMQAAIDSQFEVNKRERLGAAAFAFDAHGLAAVKVLGPKAGRRRIGHSFGPEESIVRVNREELELLLGDDLLAVGQA